MPCNDSNFHASTSRANGPTTMPRQQPRRPRSFFAPVVKQRAEQPTERIRGGCLPCPGGGIWTIACGSSGDHVEPKGEQAQPAAPTFIGHLVSRASQQQGPSSGPELYVDEGVQAQQGPPMGQVQFSPSPRSTSTHLRPPSPRSQPAPPRPSDRTTGESFLSMKPSQSTWQRLRERISSRPHGANEANGPQQNSPRSVPIHPIPFCKYELKIEWKERSTQPETR